MRTLLTILLTFITFFSFSQDKEQEALELLTKRKANNFVYQGNELVTEDKHVDAEMEYRKAISEQPNNIAGTYNLGNSYYKKGNYDEALFRQQQAAKNATDKGDKHKAFHNMGNILMKNKKCKEAVEAYKNALRNDPTDEETRYNLVLAKECAEQQKDDNKDDDKNKDKDKQDENKDQDKKDEGDQDKKEGDDQKDKDDKQNPDKGDDKKEQPKQPQPGQLSPQQIKNLLEAMNNQEQKTQEKINAEKQKGVKVRTDKDW